MGVVYSRDLNIMATGDRAATSLGINTVRLRILLTVSTLMTALAVSVSGIIGFVGLISTTYAAPPGRPG